MLVAVERDRLARARRQGFESPTRNKILNEGPSVGSAEREGPVRHRSGLPDKLVEARFLNAPQAFGIDGAAPEVDHGVDICESAPKRDPGPK